MFHILTEGAQRLKSSPEREATKILCDVKTPREAIPFNKATSWAAQGKLNVKRCCKACFRKARLSLPS